MNEPQEKLSANLRDLSILMGTIEKATITPKIRELAQEIDARAMSQRLRQFLAFIAATPPSILEIINAALPKILVQVWPTSGSLSVTLERTATLVETVEVDAVTQEDLEVARQIDDRAFDNMIRGLLGFIRRTEPDMLEVRSEQFRTVLAHAWMFSERLSINFHELGELIEAIENEAVTPEMHRLAQEVDTRTLIPELRTLVSMVEGTTTNSLEYMNSDYRAELGRIWTAPEKLSANLRALADLVEAIETEAITSRIQRLALQTERRALVPELRAVLRVMAGTSSSTLAFEQGNLRLELEQALRSL